MLDNLNFDWSQDIQPFILNNFALCMFGLAAFFMLLHLAVTRGRVSQYEIVYRWLAVFGLGFTMFYAFILHAFFPEFAESALGWPLTSDQYSMAAANFGFGLIALFSFNASIGFRTSTVVGNTCWLWGFAAQSIYQIVKSQQYEFTAGTTWLAMQILIPFVLLICISKLKHAE